MVHCRQKRKNFICYLRFIRRRGTSRNNKWAGNIPNGKMIPLQGNKNIKYTKDKGVLTQKPQKRTDSIMLQSKK